MAAMGTSSPDPNMSNGGVEDDQTREHGGSPTGDDGRAAAVDAAEEALARVEDLAGIDAEDAPPENDANAEDDAGSARSSGPSQRSRRREDASSRDEASPREESDLDLPPVLNAVRDAFRSVANRLSSVLPGFLTGSSGSPDASAEGDGEVAGELPDQCPNCGALLEGPYCSECGQKAEGRIAPLWHMLNEALEAVFELDLRVLHTLPKFLFLPGRLTKEYINGRRRRYIRPFRLYLFTTFVLFTTLTLLRPGESPFATLNVNTEPGSTQIQVRPSLPSAASGENAPPAPLTSGLLGGSTARESLARSLASTPSALPDSIVERFRRGDSLQVDRFEAWVRKQVRSDDPSVLDSTVFAEPGRASSAADNAYGSPEERKKLAQTVRDSLDLTLSLTSDSTTNERIERLVKKKTALAIENPGEFTGALTERMPYMMFLLLPVFALLLKLLYIRRGRLYMEHLIFTLHFHALTFFAFTAGVLMEEWGGPWVQEAGYWVLASPFLYLILAMRTVYEQGFVKTFFKACFLLFTYLTILLVGLVLLAILTVILM